MNKDEKKTTAKRLLGYAAKYKKRITFGLIATFIMGSIEGLTSFIFQIVINTLTLASNYYVGKKEGVLEVPLTFEKEIAGHKFKFLDITLTGQDAIFRSIIYICLIYLIVSVIKVIFVYLREILMNSSAQKILREFKVDIYNKILKLPVVFFDKNQSGTVLSRLTYDVNLLSGTINVFITISQSIIYAGIFITLMFYLNWKLTIFAVLILPTTGIVVRFFGKKITRISSTLSDNNADYNSFLQERISNQKVIKTYNNEGFERTFFHNIVDTSYNLTFKIIRLVALLKPSNEMTSAVSIVALLLFLGYQVVNGQTTFGEVIAYVYIVQSAYKPVKNLADVYTQIQIALVSAQKIFELLDEKDEKGLLLEDKTDQIKDIESIEFKNVCFEYKENEPILNNISFKAKKGEIIAFVGHSGSGKTTILNLLPRFYDIKSGEILINGINIGSINVIKLRSLFGMVHQDAQFFSGSIKDNVLYGNLTADDNDVIKSCQSANAVEFIDGFPLKYETEIGERGVQLSGGQRQRLAIARAMIKDPQVILLDEATSALDTQSERNVQEALDKMMKNRTSFVVAHRLSTIKNADKIIVIDKGQIVEVGSHEELIGNESKYKQLYDLQFS